MKEKPIPEPTEELKAKGFLSFTYPLVNSSQGRRRRYHRHAGH